MGDSNSLSTKFSYTELLCDTANGSPNSGSFPAADWAQFYFTQKEYIVAGIKVIKAEIPFVFDTISAANNKFYFKTPSLFTEAQLSIPVGNYTGPSLATAFQNALNSVAPGGFTVTWNTTTLRFDISSGTTSTIRFTGPSPKLMLGFPDGSTSLGTNASSPNAAAPSGPLYLFLNSATLGPSINCHAQDDTKNINQICKIPIDVNPGGVILYRDPNPQQFFDFISTSDFTNFDLYLTLGFDQEQVPLHTNGLGFSVTLGILQHRDGGAPINQRPGNISFMRRR